eukprot:1532019-Rhodomonas_salina.2
MTRKSPFVGAEFHFWCQNFGPTGFHFIPETAFVGRSEKMWGTRVPGYPGTRVASRKWPIEKHLENIERGASVPGYPGTRVPGYGYPGSQKTGRGSPTYYGVQAPIMLVEFKFRKEYPGRYPATRVPGYPGRNPVTKCFEVPRNSPSLPSTSPELASHLRPQRFPTWSQSAPNRKRLPKLGSVGIPTPNLPSKPGVGLPFAAAAAGDF